MNDELEQHSLIYSDAETERKRDEAWTRGDDAEAKEKRTKVSPKLHWQTLERNTRKNECKFIFLKSGSVMVDRKFFCRQDSQITRIFGMQQFSSKIRENEAAKSEI